MTLVILSFPLFSQILNSSFEEWESFPTYDKPLHWETNQDTNFVRFIKDTISYEGDYALHAVPSGVSAWTNCASVAKVGVKLAAPIGSNQSLYFYLRTLSVNANDDTYAEVSGKLFLDQTFVSNYYWITSEEYPEYSLIEIPIDEPTIDSLTIEIWAAKANAANDGCFGASQVWFDNFYIAEKSITAIKSLDEINVTIFPNPSNGRIELKGDIAPFKKFRIINLLGQEVAGGNLENAAIEINDVGVLFLILENEKGETFVGKILNQK